MDLKESMPQQTLEAFAQKLASGAPTPGGGGGAAAVGALGCALGEMVCHLTVGKKKYAECEDELQELILRLAELRTQLLAGIDEDARAFAPVAAAYSIPKDDPSRATVMEEALVGAIEAPLALMEVIGQVIDALDRLAVIGSRLALSDVGVGAVCAQAALEGASLNVFINTSAMADRQRAAAFEARADELVEEKGALARQVYKKVLMEVRS